MKKQAILVAFVGTMMFGAISSDALAAGGIATNAAMLPEKTRLALATEIDVARRERPQSFDAFLKVRQDLAAIDAKKRGRFAALTPMLKAMGKDALFPMLEELAFRGSSQATLTDSARIAWRASVIEAVGMLRDVRAEPVLASILEGPETEFHTVRAAAAALGRMGTDSAANKLIAMAKVSGDKQKAILAGMGECRRKAIASALARHASTETDPQLARVIAHSLGDVGSAWAWQTPAIAASGEEAETRATAAKALVKMFMAHEGEVRKMVANAMLVVDDPSTPGLIASAKHGASAELAMQLDALAERFARSPIRR